MVTARKIINSAFRKIHVLGVGSTLSAEEANDALDTLNAMLASWSAEGDLIFTETVEEFPCTEAETYTMGVGGDFDTVAPVSYTHLTLPTIYSV